MTWQEINRQLISKIISELHFEECLELTEITQNLISDSTSYRLKTLNRSWEFQAQVNIWGGLIIEPASVQTNDNSDLSASQLLIDLQEQLALSEITLSNLLEEIQQTLYCDLNQAQARQQLTSHDFVGLSEVARQQYLTAHPKAIANKGRLGWGATALAQYSPESAQPFQLHFVAVHRQQAMLGISPTLTYHEILRHVLQEDFATLQQRLVQTLKQAQALSTNCQTNNTNSQTNGVEQYLIVAVHPWQMQQFIRPQFAMAFSNQQLIDLGELGEPWLAQQSIRTLSSVNPQVRYDAKTAITILNTSCYRGVPGDFIVHGAQLSQWLKQLTEQDPVLADTGLTVQQEVAGVFCPHPYQAQVAGGAYRHQEMLGCIWRERAEAVVASHQRPMSMASLIECDPQGEAAVVALIEQSGLSARTWLTQLFDHVAVPLYHLLAQYGVGLVAHGQNISLILQHNQVVGCLIKDFHGDLRLIDQPFAELQPSAENPLPQAVQDKLTRLPARYLLHDFVTGHIVSLLRFISPHLIALGVSEVDFYQLLGQRLKRYQQQQVQHQPALAERFAMFDLFTPTLEKVCVNKVRFKIGYGDSEQRPVPELGTPMVNPLR